MTPTLLSAYVGDSPIPHCTEKPCSGRREFLVRTLTTAGGALAGLSIAGQAAEAAPANDVVLELGKHPKLAKVGGAETIDSPVGKIIVMRTGPDSFAAVSAICTHQKGPLFYDAESGKLLCTKHGAIFASSGKVEKGPATTDLQSYVSAPAAVVHLAPAPK